MKSENWANPMTMSTKISLLRLYAHIFNGKTSSTNIRPNLCPDHHNIRPSYYVQAGHLRSKASPILTCIWAEPIQTALVVRFSETQVGIKGAKIPKGSTATHC